MLLLLCQREKIADTMSGSRHELYVALKRKKVNRIKKEKEKKLEILTFLSLKMRVQKTTCDFNDIMT